MKFRLARHTTQLKPLIDFYTQLLNLQVLGQFKDHSGYDGVFLGLPGKDWHLEFTTSTDAPVHQPDGDDLLVFYPETSAEYRNIISNLEQAHVAEVDARNPYWATNGKTYADPDGYKLVIVKAK